MDDNIKISISVDLTSLSSGLSQAQSQVNSAVANMRAAFGSLGGSMASAGNGAQQFNNSATQTRSTSGALNSLLAQLNATLNNLIGAVNRSSASTQALSTQMSQAAASGQRLGNTLVVINNTTNNFHSSSSGLTGVLGALSGAFLGLVTAQKAAQFIGEANQAVMSAEASFRGLEAVSNYMGIGVGKSMEVVGRLTADGLMTTAEASKALQNLLSRGYNIKEAENTLNRLKDSAAFNRQAHLKFGESIVGATEGLKNENSMLVDNAGVTKNVAKMWEEWAQQHGVATQNMTQAQKIQAEYNGIMKETEAQLGNAKIAAEGLQGGSSRLSAAWTNLKETVGDALSPFTSFAGRVATDVLDKFGMLVKDIQLFGHTCVWALEMYGAFMKGLGAADMSVFRAEVEKSNKKLDEYYQKLFSTKGAHIDQLPGKVPNPNPKGADDTNLKAKFNEAEEVYKKELQLAKNQRDVQNQLYENDLVNLKLKHKRALISEEEYTKKSIELQNKIIDNNKTFLEKQLDGLSKLMKFAIGDKKGEINLDTEKAKGEIAKLEAERQGIAAKVGNSISGGSKRNQLAAEEAKYAKEQAKANYDLLRVTNSAEMDLIRYKFDKNMITAEQYYARLKELQKQDFEEQKKMVDDDIAALEIRKGKSKDKAEKKSIDTEILKLNSQLAISQKELNTSIEKGSQDLADYVAEEKKRKDLDRMDIKVAKGNADLDEDQRKNQMKLALGRINNAQLIELEKGIQESRYQLEKTRLDKELELNQKNKSALDAINKEIELAEVEHNNRMAQLNHELVMEKAQDYMEFTGQVRTSMQGLLADLAKHPKDFRSIVLKALDDITNKLIDMASKKLMEQVLNPGSGGGGGLGGMLNSGLNYLAGAMGFDLPKFDVGTNYVPGDMVAQIHKGEAIVPAKYNTPEYNYGAGKLGGGNTNNLHQVNNFIMQQNPDRRTQNQIASKAGTAANTALFRNGQR